MGIVYVDNEYKCHPTNDGTMKEVQHAFFEGKCTTFIGGYCYDDSKGYVQIYPWKPYNELVAVQNIYEENLEKEKMYSQFDFLDAQVTYTAMMTDTLLGV